MTLRTATYGIFLALLSNFLTGCADLDVVNETAPDLERVISDQDQLMMLAGTTFRTFHNAMHEYAGLASPLAMLADHLTTAWCSYSQFAWEPRYRVESYFNRDDHYAHYNLKSHWKESYQAIYHANMVLERLNHDSDLRIGEEQRALMEAFCLFASGVTHGYLGLLLDKALVVKFGSDQVNKQLQPWNEVVDESLEMLDQVIQISDSHSFQVPPAWVGGQELTNVEFAQLANGYAARILAYSSRTRAQNSEIDWNRVLAYARKGLSRDFAPELGDTYDWYDFYWVYGTYQGWSRVDMRIINLMDHDYPSRWPGDNLSWNTPDGQDPGEADPDDARLLTDFEYLATNNFAPDRGYYRFSHYRYSRYDHLGEIAWYGVGIKPSFMAWEVELLKAEAQFRLGNETAALAILNDPAGPRKSRGGLPDVQQDEDILRYILDEKEIECFLTGAGISYFDMRRTDRLQEGTWLHFPVPAKELELLSLPHYTIRTVADGVDGSAGGWTGWDE